MNHLITTTTYLKNIVFVTVLVLLSNYAAAQSEETKKALQVPAVADETDTAGNKDECCLIKKNNYCRFFYVDGGGADVLSNASGKNYSANGFSWAAGIQEAYKIHSFSPNHRMLISVGLEIRNHNGIASSTDYLGGTAYDNLHYWYAGLPVIFQVLNTKYKPGKTTGLRFYGLVGVTLGAKLDVRDAYSDQGVTTTYDISRHYTTFSLQPFMSAGFTYKTPACTYMFGPYVGYTNNNLVTNTGISEYIFSYGLKLTTLFLHH